MHNFVTVHDLLKKVDPQVLRFYMSSVQYRHPINYSEDGLMQAKTILDRYQTVLRNLDERLADETESEKSLEFSQTLNQVKENFEKEMDDDFNVQNALSVIYDFVTEINTHLRKDKVDKETLKKAQELLKQWLLIFGVEFTLVDDLDNEEEISTLVNARNEARKNKDWAKSDELRDKLKEMGIILEDTPQGTRWHRA